MIDVTTDVADGESRCEWCGDTATFWDTANEEPSCEDCARYHAAHDAGESYGAGRMLAAMVDYLKSMARADEIRQAVDAVLDGGEPSLGETKRLAAIRAAGGMAKTAQLWRGRYKPLDTKTRRGHASQGDAA